MWHYYFAGVVTSERNVDIISDSDNFCLLPILYLMDNGYKGLVINLPQDITTFVPRIPKQLDVLIIRKK